MTTESRQWRSAALERDMELRVYGDAGKPAIAFPSGGGRVWDFERFGMVEACRPFLDSGRLRLYAVDGIDNESLFNRAIPVAERIRRHERYERYLLEEVVPFIRERDGERGILTTGCSGGGYHASNFLFRHPDVFDAVVSLSGLYGQHFALKDDWDDSAYLQFPLAYLPGLEDPRLLGAIRRASIVLCVGLGAWERCDDYDCIGDAEAMRRVLEAKGIPAWVDFWGPDASHDWFWWQRQLPYFLGHLL